MTLENSVASDGTPLANHYLVILF